MPLGHLLLSNKSLETKLFTENPEFTYFKNIYKRVSEFSIEDINQYFVNDYGFAKRSSCILHNNADLINKVYFVATLPNIPFLNEYNDIGTAFHWINDIGEKLIKSIEIEIDNQIIQKITGYHINIYNKLFTPQSKNLDKMIGNIPEIIHFSNFKKEYKLYIPIPFWFSEEIGNSFPINKFNINKVKINIELEDIKNLIVYGPLYYITINESSVDFNKYEYIYQSKNNVKGQFFYFDKNKKRLYYNLISKNNFDYFDNSNIIYNNLINIESSCFITNEKNTIYYTPIEQYQNVESNLNINYITLNDAYFQIRYIFLDKFEQQLIKKTKKLEYLIKQHKYINYNNIDSIKNNFNISGKNCIYDISFVAVLQSDIKNKLFFTYSDKIVNSSLSINSFNIYSKRNNDFVNLLEQFYNYNTQKIHNINSYSFTNNTLSYQPGGSLNLSKIEKFNLFVEFDKSISINNKINVYIIISNYNIFCIKNDKIEMYF